jgi:hypothetical protein
MPDLGKGPGQGRNHPDGDLNTGRMSIDSFTDVMPSKKSSLPSVSTPGKPGPDVGKGKPLTPASGKP